MAVVGQDIGYGYTKTIVPGRKPVIFPSVVGSAERLRFRSPLDTSRGMEVRLDGTGAFFVGEHALLQSRALFTSRSRKKRKDALLVLSLAGLWSLFSKGGDIYLVTGLPVDWYQDRKELIGVLKGEHRATINGQEIAFRVLDVVVMPQPFGSLLHLVLDERGVIEHTELARGRVGIIDVGMHTTDLILVDALRYVEKGSGSLPQGIDLALEGVRKALQDEYRLDLSIHEVDEAVRRGRVEVFGKEENIGPIVEPHLRALADQVYAFAADLWGDGRSLTRIVITGGGGMLLGDRLSSRWPHAEVLADAPLANARGFLKFGVRKWQAG